MDIKNIGKYFRKIKQSLEVGMVHFPLICSLRFLLKVFEGVERLQHLEDFHLFGLLSQNQSRFLIRNLCRAGHMAYSHNTTQGSTLKLTFQIAQTALFG